jgi:hypothetical protein
MMKGGEGDKGSLLHHPKVMALEAKPFPLMEPVRVHVWSNSPPSSSNSSSKRKIDKLKKKLKESKSHEVASSSSSNEETDASSEEEEAKGKKGKKGDKRSYNIASFNYDNLPHSNAFPSVPVGNPPVLMGQTIPNGDT